MTSAKKLLATLATAAAARAADPLPTPDVERRFVAWSSALSTVVANHLLDAAWHLTEWSHNPNCDNSMEFGFHYDGRLTPLGFSKPLFVSTRLTFDASLDLAQELARLAQEAKEFRQCADRMYGAQAVVA